MNVVAVVQHTSGEYLGLIRDAGLKVLWRKGLFPTMPLISLLTYVAPAASLPLHRIANQLPVPPGLCFLNVLELAKA